MHNIQVGARWEQQVIVTEDIAINFLGLPDGRVLSTPQMIQNMEQTSRNNAFRFLEAGHDTVGTKVCVTHLKAAPIGSTVTFTSEITTATDRRVEFHVEARTEHNLIGEGSHERAIINIARFAARNAGTNKPNLD